MGVKVIVWPVAPLLAIAPDIRNPVTLATAKKINN